MIIFPRKIDLQFVLESMRLMLGIKFEFSRSNVGPASFQSRPINPTFKGFAGAWERVLLQFINYLLRV